jgi:hypothetical protein
LNRLLYEAAIDLSRPNSWQMMMMMMMMMNDPFRVSDCTESNDCAACQLKSGKYIEWKSFVQM